ncbi:MULTISPECIES: hypothetical protein [unclassified Mesorhizobium]|uniref:hypothetical protein n=1 Tax=unclassified Mesorhizobium TaxID=325217 RepID=UPI003335C8A0
MALPTAFMLWLRHVLEAEHHSRHMPRCILRHEDLLSDWRHQMDRAARETGISGLSRPITPTPQSPSSWTRICIISGPRSLICKTIRMPRR